MTIPELQGVPVKFWSCTQCEQPIVKWYGDIAVCQKCGMSNYIPRTSLPKLPEEWEGPFQADGKRIRCTYGDGYAYGECTIASCASEEEATFIAALLNACYPNQENDR